MQINLNRLMSTFNEIAGIGGTPEGGFCRLALSPEDKQGRALFSQWVIQSGGQVIYDDIGNLFATFPGQNETEIMMGSHLDTQPNGGNYDGIFGVLAALETVRTLKEHGIQPKHTITIAVWTNEEGARFSPAMLGSAVYCHLLPLSEALAQVDQHGISVGSELLDLPKNRRESNRPYPIAYIEAHIEQGPILENNHMDIGVVTGGQGIIWFDLVIDGQPAHAGTTPMPLRHDPLFAFSEFAKQAETMVMDYNPLANITIGKVHSSNRSYNTIMKRISATVDIRHFEASGLEHIKNRMHAILQNICQERGVTYELSDVWYSPPQPFYPQYIDMVRESAKELGYSHQDIISGAGHDAISLAKVCPTTMIFIPCLNGISHNPAEYASPEQLEKGTMVLLKTIIKIDQLP